MNGYILKADKIEFTRVNLEKKKKKNENFFQNGRCIIENVYISIGYCKLINNYQSIIYQNKRKSKCQYSLINTFYVFTYTSCLVFCCLHDLF